MRSIAKLSWFIVVIAMFAGCGSPTPPAPGPSVPPTEVPSPTPSPDPTPSEPPLDVDALFSANDYDREAVREYVRKFVEDGEKLGIGIVEMMSESPKLEIRIASLDSWGAGVIGLCSTGSGYRILTLDPDYFNNSMTDGAKRVLVHHEMGHCVLYRDHRTAIGEIPDGTGHTHELSVMYPVMIGFSQYELHEKYYLDELFERLSMGEMPSVFICEGVKE